MKRCVSCVLLVALIVLLLCACGGGNNAFVGYWVANGGSAPRGYPDTVSFREDGTCIADGESMTWSISDGKITFHVGSRGRRYTFNYSISGSTLTLDDRVSYIKN